MALVDPTYCHTVKVHKCTDEYDIDDIFQTFSHHLARYLIVTAKIFPRYSQQKVAFKN